MAQIIRVSAKSRSTAVAGAIAGIMREEGYAEMKAIGASAVNQSIKALAITRRYLKDDNIDIAAVPSFTEVEIGGTERTAVHMAVYRQADLLAPEQIRSVQSFAAQETNQDRRDEPITIAV